MLEDGEEWTGETRQESGGFLWWDKDAIRWLIDEGMLGHPRHLISRHGRVTKTLRDGGALLLSLSNTLTVQVS